MNIRQESAATSDMARPVDVGAERVRTVPVGERVEAIDVIRGLALFGVLIVNLTTEFRVSIFAQFLGDVEAGSGLDRVIALVVALGLESKAFALFSLLFGVGLAIQFDQLARRGRPFYWLLRRLLALLAFGLAHLLLVWNGDILTEYAVVGLLVLPCLYLNAWQLALAAITALSIYLGQAALWTIPWPATSALEQHVALANTVYANGSYADVIRFAHRELPLLLPLHQYVLPRTMALFLFGMFFWRVGVLTERAAFRRPTRIAAVVGVPGGALLLAAASNGWLAAWPQSMGWFTNVAPVVLAVGYGAVILVLMDAPRTARALAFFAPLGRMAFTNYLLQSLVCGVIFFGYGLGRFGQMALAPAFTLGVVIYVVQMVLSAYWLRYFRFGPMEWLWRTAMYGKRQAMIRPRSHLPAT
jgi:uncharacterized protein